MLNVTSAGPFSMDNCQDNLIACYPFMDSVITNVIKVKLAKR